MSELRKGSRVRMLCDGWGEVDGIGRVDYAPGELGSVTGIDLYKGQGVSVTISMECGVDNVFDDGEHDEFELMPDEPPTAESFDALPPAKRAVRELIASAARLYAFIEGGARQHFVSREIVEAREQLALIRATYAEPDQGEAG